ncbi:glycosyltransferase family 2 protein [Methyloversatilis sp. NSM2]|uniref:glycosyltransferase family 2 protein n=1 Tax=Methyloversatilis sp. NSM2 TaxID=3134135 RepID=UPI00310E3773
MQDETLLSFVICTFNRAAFLEHCVSDLAKQIEEFGGRNIEVLIVDNNSNDDTASVSERLCARWPWTRYLFEGTQGLSHARNCGCLAASGAYVCYLDDDALPGTDYVRNVMGVVAGHSPDIAGGPVFPFYTSKKPFWFQDELEIRRHARTTGFVDCPVSGGNFIIRRRLLLDLGLFSSDFGMVGTQLRLGEERNLIERYRLCTEPEKRRIYYSQDCFIFHHVPAEKMTLAYFVRRAFESGRLRASIEKVRRDNGTGISDQAPPGRGLLRRILVGERGIHLPLRVLHRAALIAGLLSVRMHDKLTTRLSKG